MATVIEGLLKKLKAAEEAGNTGKASLLKKAIKKERAKKANANAQNMKRVEKAEKDQDARRAASKGGSATEGQSGAGRSIFDIIRRRNTDVDNDTKKQGG